ncbi:TonB-dependent receptor [Deinococcus deserti]|uniref:DUF11 domain-containing protein n=1 Tax=Deinococcus deserti (strain DSM 17065 / CIP 109153 / LMG 22923 / VCD115) TaxID=546414 RepID=C1CYI9_DEIDV|nr:TonB-dependent receptor [Deinococcus deserti]ACO45010.1 Conserved hypothetical protein, precursor [Deinococcus deserti VCD115]
MRNFTSLATSVTALLAAGSVSGAQEVSTSLPLTSIGDALMWTAGDQSLLLEVPVGNRVRLELYSPRLNPADSRSDRYYGDEQYAAAPDLRTTFTLLRADGTEVLARTFAPGAHEWDILFDQTLPAGKYVLRSVTHGAGKNTFAVRLAGVSAAMSAERLTVNIHSRDWVPALSVTTDGQGYALRMYDGDGPTELEARLRDAQGHVYPLTVSRDLSHSDLPIPAAPGTYTVELRQAPGARQFSNAVGFALSRQGTPRPITVARVDQTGQLRVSAELLLPGRTLPAEADLLLGGSPVHVNGTQTQPTAAGTFMLTPAAVPGAKVTAPASVTVPRGGVGEARVQVQPQVALSLQADKAAVCLGDTVTLTARATTAYAGSLPLDLSLDVPAGVQTQGQTRLEAPLSAAQPGELLVSATATQAGPLTFTARLAPWAQAQTVRVNVLPVRTSLQLARMPLPDTAVGEEVRVGLTVTNTAAEPAPFTLRDQAGEGLQALEPARFEGTLAAGETRTLSYRARVVHSGQTGLTATLSTPGCAVPQLVSGEVLGVNPASVPAAPAATESGATGETSDSPVVVRSSVITMPFDAPGGSIDLVIAHTLPTGAELVVGSSQLDGQTLPDPRRGAGGTLYWMVPTTVDRQGVTRGVVTYEVRHESPLGTLDAPSLLSRFPGDRHEPIAGRVDLKDLAAAQSLTQPSQVTENEGAIKLPLQGSVVRVRDRVSIVVEAPLGAAAPALSVNGLLVSPDRVGQTTEDPGRGVVRLTYVGVPVQPGPNLIQFGDARVTVQRAGPTARVEVTPVSLMADGSTPLRLRIRTLDAFGNLSNPGTVTVRTNLETRAADASNEVGYQVRLSDGEGLVELQPQSSPTTLNLDVVLGENVKRYSYEVKPDAHRVGVGLISATAGLDGSFSVQDDVSWQARATYEGPLAGGKLYIAADKDGLPTDRNTLRRYASYGDNSIENVPLQGIDPVALTYDHPNFRVQYRQSALPISVLPVGEQLTALTAYSKTNPLVSAFVAALPSDRISGERLTLQGNRLLRLARGNIAEGSETLELLTLERTTGKELSRVTLVRNADYQLDPTTGIVTLARALDPLDAQLNDVAVLASYRLANAADQRKLAYGAQAKYTGQDFTVGVAAVRLDDQLTFGARATYDNGTTRADGLLAVSGGVQLSADVSTRFGQNTLNAKVRYQDESYAGLAPLTPGLSGSASFVAPLTTSLRAAVDAEYHAPAGAESGGSLTARADYRLAPFSVGAGLRYAFGDSQGLGAVLGAGYHQGPVDVDVSHTQPLSGNLKPETSVTTRYRLSNSLSLGFTDKITWGLGHAAAVTLDSAVGNVNYAAAYELPGASGQGNRARFGVSTSLPLTENLTAGLRASATYTVSSGQFDAGAGVDLHHKGDGYVTTTGTDVTYGAQGFGVVMRAGIAGNLSENLNLTADGLVEFGAGKNGQRAAVGYAYRSRNFNSLGTVRFVNGTLAGGQPELSSNVSAEYRQSNYAVRGALDTRMLLLDRASLTAQASFSGTYYLTDRLGLGAWGRMITQPATQTTEYGYGLEASFRALPGTWVTAGYNPVGFSGIGTSATYTKKGAYVRLDLTLDETLGGDR